jgi:aldose 1-epimerase
MSSLKQRFQIAEENFGNRLSYKLTDIQTGEYARILPYLGGTIQSIFLKKNEQLYNILDGYTSSEDAEKNLNSSFKGSNLFPFPNRVRDGKYSHNGKEYQLAMNFPQENNAIHGLIYDKAFKIINKENGDNFCTLVILYNTKEAMHGYPFDYTLEVEYRWRENGQFECISTVRNPGIVEIPIGIGWHPYFVAGNVNVNDLWIQFPAEKILQVDDRQIPTGASDSYTSFNQLSKVDNTFLDSCFTLKLDSVIAETIIFNKEENFGYKIWQETGKEKYNFLQVYTPPSRNSIAFEPMTCAPDALNNKNGLILLAPGKSVSVKWGVSSLY